MVIINPDVKIILKPEVKKQKLIKKVEKPEETTKTKEWSA